MLFITLICFIVFLAYWLGRGDFSLPFGSLRRGEEAITLLSLVNSISKEENWKEITVRTTMSEEYPTFLMTRSADQINKIMSYLNELELTLARSEERGKGWQFWISLYSETDKVDITLIPETAYIGDDSYHMKGYDSAELLELFQSIDSEWHRYPG